MSVHTQFECCQAVCHCRLIFWFPASKSSRILLTELFGFKEFLILIAARLASSVDVRQKFVEIGQVNLFHATFNPVIFCPAGAFVV